MRARPSLALAALTVLALSAIAAPAIGQAGGLGIDVAAGEATPGETATVSFDVTNDGGNASAAIVNVTELPDWETVNRTDAGGIWREDGKWLFQTIDGGDAVSPSLTLSVPANATGEYDVAAVVTTGEASDTVEATIQVEGGGAVTPAAEDIDGGPFSTIPTLALVGAVVVLSLAALVWYR